MKKRIAGLALAVAMLFALASCGAKSASSSSAASSEAAIGSVSEIQGSSSSSASSAAETYDYSAGLTDEGFFEGVTASDIITLPEYKGVTVPGSVLTVTDDAVQEQVTQLLSSYTTYEHVMDRAVADGDTVNIDYVGKVDGAEFSGGSTNGAGTDVTIGTTQFIDDFLDQVVGHKPGETFDVNVTFPDPYTSNTALSGKDAVFTVTVNYIRGTATVPELTDELASTCTSGSYTTAESLRSAIGTYLLSQQKDDYIQELLGQSTCSEVPQSVIDTIAGTSLASYAAKYGVTVDTLLTNGGYASKDAFVTANADSFKKTAIVALAIQAIAEKENLRVDDAALTDSGLQSYESTYGLPYIRMNILEGTTVPDFIFSNAAK